jgi:hypothetical protein
MRLQEHLAKRTALASAVMAATFATCAVACVSADPAGSPDRMTWAVMFAMGACYFASLGLVAHARGTSRRTRDTAFGMMAPSMGYAAAVPAAIAVPLAVLDSTVATLGPVSPAVAILSGMAAVLGLMLLARALETRIDPPVPSSFDPSPVQIAAEPLQTRELKDMP